MFINILKIMVIVILGCLILYSSFHLIKRNNEIKKREALRLKGYELINQSKEEGDILLTDKYFKCGELAFYAENILIKDHTIFVIKVCDKKDDVMVKDSVSNIFFNENSKWSTVNKKGKIKKDFINPYNENQSTVNLLANRLNTKYQYEYRIVNLVVLTDADNIYREINSKTKENVVTSLKFKRALYYFERKNCGTRMIKEDYANFINKIEQVSPRKYQRIIEKNKEFHFWA